MPPLMVRTEANPEGQPKEVFDDLQAQLAANRSVFYRAVAAACSTGSTGPRRNPMKRSSKTGGARA